MRLYESQCTTHKYVYEYRVYLHIDIHHEDIESRKTTQTPTALIGIKIPYRSTRKSI